ncbi:TPA: hypothetical protein ACU8B2_002115 [Neisseria subflava]
MKLILSLLFSSIFILSSCGGEVKKHDDDVNNTELLRKPYKSRHDKKE